MKIPLQISSRKFTLTDRLIDIIKQKAAKLEQFYSEIIACRVMVEIPHRHKHHGVLYNVSIDLTVPGGELVVKREPNEDINIALREAFDAARRQLLTYSRRRRHDARDRSHATVGAISQDVAQISTLFSEQGFGYLMAPDGREIYFSRNDLLDSDFDDLEVGRLVRFTESREKDMPRASGVSPA